MPFFKERPINKRKWITCSMFLHMPSNIRISLYTSILITLACPFLSMIKIASIFTSLFLGIYKSTITSTFILLILHTGLYLPVVEKVRCPSTSSYTFRNIVPNTSLSMITYRPKLFWCSPTKAILIPTTL